MEQVLTAQQAKSARNAAHLSQGKAATDLGINRSYLSLFESGKYVLDDNTLTQLRDYYQDHGVNLDGAPGAPGNAKAIPASTASDSARLRDGFLLPDATDDDEADALLTEYAENREKISALYAEDLTKGFFCTLLGVDDYDAAEPVNKVLTLMARNFAIIERLQGHDTVLLPTPADAKREKRTTADFVSARFVEAFGLRDGRTARDE
jgi:transcriptional regulator with XRE-family HTH domain